MVSNDLYQSSDRSARVPHVFGLLGKLHLLFLAALVVFPPLLSAQWNATIGAQSADLGRQGLLFCQTRCGFTRASPSPGRWRPTKRTRSRS